MNQKNAQQPLDISYNKTRREAQKALNSWRAVDAKGMLAEVPDLPFPTLLFDPPLLLPVPQLLWQSLFPL